MRKITKFLFFAVIIVVLIFIVVEPNDIFPPDIFFLNSYSSIWLDTANNVQFYSGGYPGMFYGGIIFPYNNFENFTSDYFKIISNRKVAVAREMIISGNEVKFKMRDIKLPNGSNIVLLRPDMNAVFLDLSEKYFFKDENGHKCELNIEELKKDGIWDSKIAPNLNANIASTDIK